MSYSDIYLKRDTKPPAILVVLAILAVGGFAFTFFKPSLQVNTTRASKETLLSQTIANLTSRQAAVYYETVTPVKSWILYGTKADRLDNVSLDDRDTETVKNSVRLHLISLNDLQENTTYYYKIITDNEVIAVNGVSTFSFTTAKASIANTSIPPAYGKVVTKTQQPVDNAFVTYYYPGAYPLVATVKGGDWLVALSTLIDRSTGKSLFPINKENVKLVIAGEDEQTTTIETTLEQTTPLVKTVVLGLPYTVEGNDAVLSANTQVTNSPTIVQSTVQPTAVVTKAPVSSPTAIQTLSLIEISFPKEGAVIPGTYPLIKGVGVTGKDASLSLVKDKKTTIYSTKTKIDAKGEWKLDLPMALSAGDYQLSLATQNDQGAAVNIKRSFSIAKSGENVLGLATDSATLVPSPSPTLIASAPTSTPTPFISPLPSVTPPVTGFDGSFVMIGSLALIIIGAGVMLLL